MDMETACKQLKAGKVVRFWYCAADGSGNPLLMLDKKRIPQKDIKAAKSSARKKQFCGGHMQLKKGVLTAFTDDGAPNLFDKKVKLLLGNFIQRPREVEVKEAALADGILQEEASDTGAQSLDEHYEGESEGMEWRTEQYPDEKMPSMLKGLLKKPKLRDELAAAMGLSANELADEIQAKIGDPTALREILKKCKFVTTKYFDEHETERATTSVDDEGRILDADGLVMDTTYNAGKKSGFAVDDASGELRTFDPAMEGDRDQGYKMTHHSSSVQGKDVKSAGHIEVDQGRLSKIDDQSGHYKPDATKTLQALQHLEKLGVKMVDDRLLDENGDPVSPRHLPAGLKDRAKWMKAYEKAHDLRNQELAKTGQKQVPYSDQYNAIRDELKAAKVWFSNKSTDVELLGKNGISEKEWDKVAGDLNKLNKLIEEKTGIAGVLAAGTAQNVLNSRPAVNFEIGKATKVTLSKEQFEQTGGNEAQIRNKQSMQDELLAKTGKVRATATDATVAAKERELEERRRDREGSADGEEIDNIGYVASLDEGDEAYLQPIAGAASPAQNREGYDAVPDLVGGADDSDDEDVARNETSKRKATEAYDPPPAPDGGYVGPPSKSKEKSKGKAKSDNRYAAAPDAGGTVYTTPAENRDGYDAVPDLDGGEED